MYVDASRSTATTFGETSSQRGSPCTDESLTILPADPETQLLWVLLDEATGHVNRVWGNWGEYTLDPKWRDWALDKLGAAKAPIHIDLFAEPWSATAPMYITRDMDAFSYNWTALQEESGGLLWANPPFRMLSKVAQKISSESCWIALCTPEKDEEEWWAVLEGVPHKRERFPQRVRLFFGGYRKTALPQRGWRTVVWLLDNREHRRQEGSIGKGLSELNAALLEHDQVKWSHGKRGGKPMVPGRGRAQLEEGATITGQSHIQLDCKDAEVRQTPVSPRGLITHRVMQRWRRGNRRGMRQRKRLQSPRGPQPQNELRAC